jgi:uncharacterized membrane protein YraQ (UPF0718 family)
MIFIFLILGLLVFYIRGARGVYDGFNETLDTFKNVWLLLILAFGIAGFLQVLIPQDIVSNYLGTESGWKGLFIGWGIGAILPGAPYTILPVAASLLKAGSVIGPVMSMVLTASIGVAITRIPYEVAFLGWKFTALRILSSLFVPILGGFIAKYLNLWLGFYSGNGL